MSNLILSIWPSTVEGWVGLIILIVGLISSITALIPTAIKAFKATKKLIKNKNFGKIKEIALKAIEVAEATGADGATKKDMVFAAVKTGCREAGIEIEEDQFEELSKYIDEMIKYFNTMKRANALGKK